MGQPILKVGLRMYPPLKSKQKKKEIKDENSPHKFQYKFQNKYQLTPFANFLTAKIPKLNVLKYSTVHFFTAKLTKNLLKSAKKYSNVKGSKKIIKKNEYLFCRFKIYHLPLRDKKSNN